MIAEALNDVGWDVWSGDFSQWMTHLNASNNSIGRWRIGAPNASEMGYGRFGRSVKKETSALSLKLDPAMWGGKMPATVWARVAYWQTTSQPNLACVALEYQQSTGARVSIAGTSGGGGTWSTDVLPLRDLASGAELSLGEAPSASGRTGVVVERCEVVFHSIEILKDKPK